MTIQEKIENIMKELIDNDPELKAHEPAVRKIIGSLLQARPDAVVDEAFRAELRWRLLAMPATSRVPQFTFVQFFTNKLALATSAAGIVAVLLFVTVWMNSSVQDSSQRTIPVIQQDVEFSLSALNQDTLGVDATSAFALSSSSPVDEATIRGNLAIEPAVHYKLESSDSNKFTIIPEQTLDANTIYKFSMVAQKSEAEQKREYQWAFQTKDSFKIMNTLPRDQGTEVPVNSGIEITFSHENYGAVEDHFTITPVANGRFERYRKTLVFVPDSLQVNTVYTVRVSAGVPLEGTDQTLAEDYQFQFETEPTAGYEGYYSYFEFTKKFFEYRNDETPVATVYGYDSPSSVHVGVYSFETFGEFKDAVSRLNIVPYWTRYAQIKNSFPVNSLTLQAEFDADVRSESYQNYIEFPEALPNGYYLIDVPIDNYHAQAFLQIGDLAASYQASPVNSFIWLHDLSTGQPVGGADITFSHSPSFSAETDGDGLAAFTSPSEIQKDEYGDMAGSYFFAVSTNDQQLLVPVAHYYGFSGYFGSTTPRDYWTYLYTNRTLYSPDDSVKFWGVIQPRSGVGDVDEVEVRFVKSANYYTSSEDEIISQQRLPVSSFHTFQGSIDYSHLTPEGYTLQVLAGDEVVISSYVSVATYTKPTYKIDVTTPKKAIFQGENAIFNIQSVFFDGTPVGNLELEYTGALGGGRVTTDENGQATVTLSTSYQPDSSSPRYEYFSIHPTSVELTDIYTDAYIYTFGSQYSIDGAATPEGAVSGSVHMIDLERVNASGDEFAWEYDGDPVAGAKVTLSVYHEYYTKSEIGTRYDFISKKTYKTYDYQYHSDEMTKMTVTTGADGLYNGQFTPEVDQNYRIVMEVTDPNGRTATTSSYVWMGLRSYYFGEGYDRYYIETLGGTEGPYRSGEEVTLGLFRNEERLPEQSGENILFFKGQREFFDIAPSSQANTTLTVTDAYAPNIYVYAVYFDGRAYHLADSTQIIFDKSVRGLSIDIRQNKDAYRPGEDVTLDLTVTNADGNPAEALVNVSAIDEALAAIQWENSNAILDTLYRIVPLTLTYSYQTHEQALRPMAEGGGCFAGDTEVLMSDGTAIPISEVRIGDEVLTYTSLGDMTLVPARVMNTLEHNVDEYLVINGSLTVTPEHIIWLNDRWQPIGNARVGDRVVNAQGTTVQITSITRRHDLLTVYNLHVEGPHTFFANGVYVHNEKGGGRQNFQDVAVFESVETDRNGRATVTFKLPDNITSWQTTVHAVTEDLKAGATQTAVIGTLPFFVDVATASDYVVGDRPQVLVRSFGRELSNAPITYVVSYPGYRDEETTLTGAAGEAVAVTLPEFSEGTFKIRVAARQGVNEDAVIRSFTFHDSNITQGTAGYYRLEEGMAIAGSGDGRTSLSFTNLERGQYFQDLREMTWPYGDRLEQQLGQWGAQGLLNEFYADDGSLPNITFTDFQTSEGGIAILPYSSADLLLTAKALLVAPDLFDRIAARQYFESVLDNSDSNTDEVVYALLGVAALDEPVLTDINIFLANHDIEPQQKLYLIRAVAHLGATEYAASMLQEILDDYASVADPLVEVKLGEDHDDYVEYTYQAAIVAAAVSSDQAPMLYRYATTTPAAYQLNTLDQLSYIQTVLPLLSAEPVSFTYTLDGESHSVTLSNEETFNLSVTPEQLETLAFTGITGDVGLVASYEEPVDLATAQTDNNLKVTRRYEVNGRATTTFHENDIVKVVISPSIDTRAIDSEYQITDYLPAGLKLLSNLSSRNLSYDRLLEYPYEVNGQAVKFWTGKPRSSEFFYYAVVIGKGTFVAEAPQVQGFVATSSVNYGTTERVTIE
ncbi:MAG: Ig-like domain-containing protein [Parcubacteria group bacterium]